MTDPLRQEFWDKVRAALPGVIAASGSNDQTHQSYWDMWVQDPSYSVQKNRWFADYISNGLTQHLLNSITHYYNLPSVGYVDFSNAAKVQGDEYRAYVASAQAVYDMAIAQLSRLQVLSAKFQGTAFGQLIDSEITLEESTISANKNNLTIWKQTLANALANGSAV